MNENEASTAMHEHEIRIRLIFYFIVSDKI